MFPHQLVYVCWSCRVTVLVPGSCAGVTASISLSDTTVNDAAGVEPKVNPFAPVRPDPLTLTWVPPLLEPL